jgi:hypothetical protein
MRYGIVTTSGKFGRMLEVMVVAYFKKLSCKELEGTVGYQENLSGGTAGILKLLGNI